LAAFRRASASTLVCAENGLAARRPKRALSPALEPASGVLAGRGRILAARVRISTGGTLLLLLVYRACLVNLACLAFPRLAVLVAVGTAAA